MNLFEWLMGNPGRDKTGDADWTDGTGVAEAMFQRDTLSGNNPQGKAANHNGKGVAFKTNGTDTVDGKKVIRIAELTNGGKGWKFSGLVVPWTEGVENRLAYIDNTSGLSKLGAFRMPSGSNKPKKTEVIGYGRGSNLGD